MWKCNMLEIILFTASTLSNSASELITFLGDALNESSVLGLVDFFSFKLRVIPVHR